MYAGSGLNVVYHGGSVPQLRRNVHADGQRGYSVDWNRVMNRQDVSVIFRDNFENIRQNPRLIIHLENKRDGLSLSIVVKGKNIILILIERTAADSGGTSGKSLGGYGKGSGAGAGDDEERISKK